MNPLTPTKTPEGIGDFMLPFVTIQFKKPPIFDTFIPGIPKTQGSKNAIPFMWNGKIRSRVIENNHTDLKSWRHDVGWGVKMAFKRSEPLRDPIFLVLDFYRPRPKQHYLKQGNISPTAPTWPATKPDLDKLIRAIKDSMTAIVYMDDGQVVGMIPFKFFGRNPGVRIRVWSI